MEQHLGADLSGVRVHTGGEAAQAASDLGARAFTVGADVHFGAGEYQPGTKEGDRLLAHELTHTVQAQGSGIARKSEDSHEQHDTGELDGDVSQPSEPAEKEADAVSDHVADALHGKGHEQAAPAPISAALEHHVGRKVGSSSTPSKSAATRPPVSSPATKTPETSPSGPSKPTDDAGYRALPGFATFAGNCASFGFSPVESLQFWKLAMDQLYTNKAHWDQLAASGRGAEMDGYVDTALARNGFMQMANLLLEKKPLDTSKSYAFWSGKPSHTYAESHGYAVLEGVTIGKVFANVNTFFSSEWPVMKTLWRAISDVYAERIAEIMKGKKIHVFQRKAGEVFAQVEQPAVKRVFQKARTVPEYMFHPLITDGVFGGDGMFDKPKSNPFWRQELKNAAAGDEAKAKAAAEAQHVRIFDYAGDVPEGMLVDKGPKTTASASKAIVDANDGAILAGCEAAKTSLERKARRV